MPSRNRASQGRRFFSDQSFWNQPIPSGAALYPSSPRWIEQMGERWGNLYLNCEVFAIPVFEADSSTPRFRVKQRGPRPGVAGPLLERERRYRLHPEFAASEVPIPECAFPDPEDDAHLAVVDWDSGLAWDMWRAQRCPDGSWESSTGMVYSIRGSGVWDRSDFVLSPGDSAHFHGPSRASGVPAIAGLILEDEIRAGVIRHKLAFAGACGRLRFAWPATWTDGANEEGPFQGMVLQLDPSLDLGPFSLSPAARTIARALQEYGAVAVDGARGNVIYAEGLRHQPGRSWKGLLHPDDLRPIPITHFRWLQPDSITEGGDPFWYGVRFDPPDSSSSRQQ